MRYECHYNNCPPELKKITVHPSPIRKAYTVKSALKGWYEKCEQKTQKSEKNTWPCVMSKISKHNQQDVWS